MDNLVQLYTTFSGRISRKTFWIGVVGIVIASIVLNIILGIVGLGFGAGPTSAAWGSLIVFVILAVPALAISIKRRHDRNGSGNDVIVYYALTLISLLVQALGFGYTTTDVGGVAMPVPTMTLTIFLSVLGIFALYLLVVLGFLRGTAGPNQYGADPVGGATVAAE